MNPESVNSKIDLNSETVIKVRKQIVKAIAEFDLIEEGDKVMVCVSGGKDSSILLTLLNEIQRRAPYNYTIEAALLDQKQPGFDAAEFQKWVENEIGVKLHILQRDTYSIVKEKITDGVYCSLCSRLRRAILYDFAVENKFTKLALGHHREDFNETLLLNLFYTGKISAMPPKLLSDDKRNIVIRPMMYVSESDLISIRDQWSIPTIPCNLCGSQDNLNRKKIKRLIADLESSIPNIKQSLLTAQSNVKLSQLSDESHWDFAQLTTYKDITNNSTDSWFEA